MKILLCGPPCSGKSTIAKLVASRLGWEAIDTDQIIEKKYQREKADIQSCREIYKHEGEKNFRKMENKALCSFKNEENVVIALGGGVKETAFLQEEGVVIYLRATLDTLWKRILQRPQLPVYLEENNARKSFERLIEKRLPAYASMAEITIDTDSLTPEKVVDRICDTILIKEEVPHGIK
ncbi:MAG: Shikimate kinase [Chlamydiae bacterium]|nr:Shikimate kinase [Chlamydiota bacterium]